MLTSIFEITTDQGSYSVTGEIADGAEPGDKALICLACGSGEEDCNDGWAWMTPDEARAIAAALLATVAELE